MLVAGVPSMHICLDFMPELLSQPDLEKQIFAAELASHLALQFPIPRCYSTGRLVINTLTTLLEGGSARQTASRGPVGDSGPEAGHGATGEVLW